MTKITCLASLFEILYRCISIPTITTKFEQLGKYKMPNISSTGYPSIADIENITSDIFNKDDIEKYIYELHSDINRLSPLFVCKNTMPLQYLNNNLAVSKLVSRENLFLKGPVIFNERRASDVYSEEILKKLTKICGESTTVGEANLAVIPSNILHPYDTYIYSINYAIEPFSTLEFCSNSITIQDSLLDDKSDTNFAIRKITNDKSQLIKNAKLLADITVVAHAHECILAEYNIKETEPFKSEVRYSLKYSEDGGELREFVGFNIIYKDVNEEYIHLMARYAGFELETEAKVKLVSDLYKAFPKSEIKSDSKTLELDAMLKTLVKAPEESFGSDDEEEDDDDEGEDIEETWDESKEKLEDYPVRKEVTKVEYPSTVITPETIKRLSENIPDAGEW